MTVEKADPAEYRKVKEALGRERKRLKGILEAKQEAVIALKNRIKELKELKTEG